MKHIRKFNEANIKGETLVEIAENFWLNDDSMTDNDRISYVNGFLACARWQQEQDKKLYSEEELRDICKKYVWFIQSKRPLYKEQLEWFEQFKK